MTEPVVQAFCERCGTRHTAVDHHYLPPAPESKGVLGRFGRKATPAEAPREPGAITTAEPSDPAFEGVFHFCIECRQYACDDCWNGGAGRCLTCRPPGFIERPLSNIATTAERSSPGPSPAPSPDLPWLTEAGRQARRDVDEWGRPRAQTPRSATTETPDASAAAAPGGDGVIDPWRGIVFSSQASVSSPAASSRGALAPAPDLAAPAPESPAAPGGVTPGVWPEADRPSPGSAAGTESSWPGADRRSTEPTPPGRLEPDAVSPAVAPEPEVVAQVTPEPDAVSPAVAPEPEVVAQVTPEPEVVPEAATEPEKEPEAEPVASVTSEVVLEPAPEAVEPAIMAVTEPRQGEADTGPPTEAFSEPGAEEPSWGISPELRELLSNAGEIDERVTAVAGAATSDGEAESLSGAGKSAADTSDREAATGDEAPTDAPMATRDEHEADEPEYGSPAERLLALTQPPGHDHGARPLWGRSADAAATPAEEPAPVGSAATDIGRPEATPLTGTASAASTPATVAPASVEPPVLAATPGPTIDEADRIPEPAAADEAVSTPAAPLEPPGPPVVAPQAQPSAPPAAPDVVAPPPPVTAAPVSPGPTAATPERTPGTPAPAVVSVPAQPIATPPSYPAPAPQPAPPSAPPKPMPAAQPPPLPPATLPLQPPPPPLEVWATSPSSGPFGQPYQPPAQVPPAPPFPATPAPPGYAVGSPPPGYVPSVPPLQSRVTPGNVGPVPQAPMPLPPGPDAVSAPHPRVAGPPGMPTKTCPNCGLQLSTKARFCRRCGSPQP
jgi:hypothetical protein